MRFEIYSDSVKEEMEAAEEAVRFACAERIVELAGEFEEGVAAWYGRDRDLEDTEELRKVLEWVDGIEHLARRMRGAVVLELRRRRPASERADAGDGKRDPRDG